MGVEAERFMRFDCPLGNDMLWVRHFSGSEALGDCFEYSVMLFSKYPYIKGEDILGQSATVEVLFNPDKPRYFNGIVCEFGYVGTQEGHYAYRAVLRPWFWLLSRNRECRIYQNMTTLDIKTEIFSRYAFAESEEHCYGTLTPREYCVQYRESDFDFVSRLFESDGLYYYFKHEKDKHTLVALDSPSAHSPASGYEEVYYGRLEDEKQRSIGVFYEWSCKQSITSGKLVLSDFNFKKSRSDMKVDRAEPKKHEHADGEIFDYPGRYVEVASGEDNAKVRLEELQVGYDVSRGVTDSRGLSTGSTFKLKGHPREAQNKEYLIVGTHYDIDSGSFRSGTVSHPQMTTHVTVIDKTIQYRPASTTPIPRIPGPQTAKVVGPKDVEIWTDEFGRVKVQFPWDRYGKNDATSSCFVRVSQAWAGSDFGSMHIPRIGQEVLVDFIDGDLDRPIIVGRVYNDANMPPFKLTDNATQSGIRSHTIKGPKDAYNELRFEDKQDEELVNLQAQKDLTTKVKHNSSTTIGNNHTHKVKKDMRVTVEEGSYETKVEKKNFLVEAKTKIKLVVGTVSIELDDKSIKLTTPTASLVLGPDGAVMKGLPIKLNP